MNTYSITNTSVPLTEWDVLVAGAGPAGCAAAVAAAREGARTLLIEATGALGGMGTMGLMPGWCGFTDEKQFIARGLAERVRVALLDREAKADPDNVRCIPAIDNERLKRIYDDMVSESGATIWFHTALAGVDMQNDGAVGAVLVANKDGLSAVKAKVYVDCTGDADLAAWAGAEFQKGNENGEMQPVTHIFLLSNVNDDGFSTPPDYDWKRRIIEDPKYPLIQDDFFGTGGRVAPGTYRYNCGHQWHVDGTSTQSLSQALIDGRRMAAQFLDALREHWPEAFNNAYLAVTAPLLGVRETRRIVGDYMLTADDHQACRHFEDEIACSSFFIDLHPTREEAKRHLQGQPTPNTQWDKSTRLAPGQSHGIPYRCLTPRGLSNVLVAGRSISSDRESNGGLRVMPPCLAMGEAAGMAAGMAVDAAADVRAIDVARLRQKLRDAGAYLPEVETVSA